MLQVRSGTDMILDDGTNSVLRSIWLPLTPTHIALEPQEKAVSGLKSLLLTYH